MQAPRPAFQIPLTSDQEALLSRIADLIQRGDQGGIKEPLAALIKSLSKPSRQWSENGIKDLLWEATARALRAAGISDVVSAKDLENKVKELERGANTEDENPEKRLTLLRISNVLYIINERVKESIGNIR
jgi:hypothetical protein